MFSRSLLFLMPVLFPAHNSTWHGQNLPCKQQLPHLPRKQVPTLRKWSCDPKFSYHGCWSGWSDKKKTEPGTRGWLRKGLQILMDGLADWPTDGRQVQYLSEYVFDAKKGPFKIRGKYFQKSAKSFWKKKNDFAHHFWKINWFCTMEKRVGLSFWYHFWNQGEILNKTALFKYFST